MVYHLVGFRFLCVNALTRPAVALVASSHKVLKKIIWMTKESKLY